MSKSCKSKELVAGSGYRVMGYRRCTVPFPNLEEIQQRGVDPNREGTGCGNSDCRGRTRYEVGCDTCIFGYQALKSGARARWLRGKSCSRMVWKEYF